jgi:hypothetical protein
MPAEGGTPGVLVDAENETDRIDATFPGSGSTFAYTVAGSIYRVELADGTASQIEDRTAKPGSVTYDGLGSSIVFLDDAGDLVRAPVSTLAPEAVAASVTAFWPIASSPNVLAVSDGVLRLVSLEAP